MLPPAIPSLSRAHLHCCAHLGLIFIVVLVVRSSSLCAHPVLSFIVVPVAHSSSLLHPSCAHLHCGACHVLIFIVSPVVRSSSSLRLLRFHLYCRTPRALIFIVALLAHPSSFLPPSRAHLHSCAHCALIFFVAPMRPHLSCCAHHVLNFIVATSSSLLRPSRAHLHFFTHRVLIFIDAPAVHSSSLLHYHAHHVLISSSLLPHAYHLCCCCAYIIYAAAVHISSSLPLHAFHHFCCPCMSSLPLLRTSHLLHSIHIRVVSPDRVRHFYFILFHLQYFIFAMALHVMLLIWFPMRHHLPCHTIAHDTINSSINPISHGDSSPLSGHHRNFNLIQASPTALPISLTPAIINLIKSGKLSNLSTLAILDLINTINCSCRQCRHSSILLKSAIIHLVDARNCPSCCCWKVYPFPCACSVFCAQAFLRCHALKLHHAVVHSTFLRHHVLKLHCNILRSTFLRRHVLKLHCNIVRSAFTSSGAQLSHTQLHHAIMCSISSLHYTPPLRISVSIHFDSQDSLGYSLSAPYFSISFWMHQSPLHVRRTAHFQGHFDA